MADHRDLSVDATVLEELLQALLEVAARKDALRSWPRDTPPDTVPAVQARRDEDGTLGVFRFFTIVVPDPGSLGPDPVRELTADEARARIEGIEGNLRQGDEVGVELPLGRLAAIALADVEATVSREPAAQLLPARIVEMLGDAALAAAVMARLSSLRGPPPHVPLRRLVTDFGGDAVEWTAVCADRPSHPGGAAASAAADADDEEQHETVDDDDEGDIAEVTSPGRVAGELIVLVARGDEHKLVVVPTATSAAGHAALLRALAPLPDDGSLWKFLEDESPALLNGKDGALWSDDGAPPAPDARRLSLEVKSITISRDPTVYGVARAKVRLLTWAGDKIVDEQEATIGLPVDLPRIIDVGYPEGEALDRVLAAAGEFRKRLAARLSALVEARAPTVADVLGGAAYLRVLARAAAGEEMTRGAELPVLRELVDPPKDWPEDEIGLRIADLGVLVLSPGDDVVKLRTGDPRSASGAHELFVDGALIDGDVDAWRAFTETFAQAVVDAGVDIELAFPADSGGAEPEGPLADADAGNSSEAPGDVETMLLSAWLLSLGEQEVRWPPRAHAAEGAAALQLLVDRFVDAGPGGADAGGRR